MDTIIINSDDSLFYIQTLKRYPILEDDLTSLRHGHPQIRDYEHLAFLVDVLRIKGMHCKTKC